MNEVHMLEVQRFLRSGGTLEALKTEYAIKAKKHPDYPIWLLVYDQIASKPSQQIVRECRGLILDESNDWAIVSHAFNRFANDGEGWADFIHWPYARVQEKVDGSLATLYAYDGKWHVATKGTPDASGDVNGHGITFREYFWQTFATYGDPLPPVTDGRCFVFELSGPMNRVVVNHQQPHLTLLTVRDLTFDQEQPLSSVNAFPSIPRVKEFALNSPEQVRAFFVGKSALELEGVVVVDNSWHRLKIKMDDYVRLHHCISGMSRKAMLEIARKGETSEVMASFPELAKQMDAVKSDLDALVAKTERDYDAYKAIENQKEFAMSVNHLRWSGALFTVRRGKAENVRAYYADCQINHLVELLGYRGADESVVKEAA